MLKIDQNDLGKKKNFFLSGQRIQIRKEEQKKMWGKCGLDEKTFTFVKKEFSYIFPLQK